MADPLSLCNLAHHPAGVMRDVIWSESGELVAIIGDSSFYILSFNR